MVNEKGRKEIIRILKDSITPGNFYYLKKDSDPLSIFRAIHSILLDNSKIESFSYEKFMSLFSTFKGEARKDFDKASSNFLEGLNSPSKPSSISYSKTSKIKKPKGVKCTRSTEWELFRSVLEILNPNSSDRIRRNLISLIKYKSYLQEEARFGGKSKSDGFIYICQVLGIPFDKYYADPKTKEMVSSINDIILSHIKFLKDVLAYLPILIEQKPYTKKWVFDVFEGNIYYKPIESLGLKKDKRRSHNKPDYQKSYDTFIKFITGTTSAELGFTSSTYHNFSDGHAPRGIIVLLRKVHELLYDEIERELTLLQEKTNQINKILEDVPPLTMLLKILPMLQEEYGKKAPKLADLLRK